MQLMYKYCDEKKIPYKKVGKLIVATDEVEVKRLEELHNRGSIVNINYVGTYFVSITFFSYSKQGSRHKIDKRCGRNSEN